MLEQMRRITSILGLFSSFSHLDLPVSIWHPQCCKNLSEHLDLPWCEKVCSSALNKMVLQPSGISFPRTMHSKWFNMEIHNGNFAKQVQASCVCFRKMLKFHSLHFINSCHKRSSFTSPKLNLLNIAPFFYIKKDKKVLKNEQSTGKK